MGLVQDLFDYWGASVSNFIGSLYFPWVVFNSQKPKRLCFTVVGWNPVGVCVRFCNLQWPLG